MQCPVDGTQLVMTERSGVEIDYCPQCRGVWLDRGELDKIIDRGAGAGADRRGAAAGPARRRTTTTATTPPSPEEARGLPRRALRLLAPARRPLIDRTVAAAQPRPAPAARQRGRGERRFDSTVGGVPAGAALRGRDAVEHCTSGSCAGRFGGNDYHLAEYEEDPSRLVARTAEAEARAWFRGRGGLRPHRRRACPRAGRCPTGHDRERSAAKWRRCRQETGRIHLPLLLLSRPRLAIPLASRRHERRRTEAFHLNENAPPGWLQNDLTSMMEVAHENRWCDVSPHESGVP